MKLKIKILLLLLFFQCSATYAAQPVPSKNSISFIRAVVGDEIITQDEVIKHAAVSIREAQKTYQDQEELLKKIEEILDQTLEELIDRKVLIKEAYLQFSEDDLMMKDIEKDLDAFVEGAVKRVGSLSKYYEIAESQGINPLEKKYELKEDIMIDKVMKENVYNKVTIQPKSMRRYYNENIDDFRQKKEVNLRHIMIKFSVYDHNKNRALSVAQEILNKLQKGEDFSILAKKYSNGPNAEKGGLWKFEEVKELRQDLREAIKGLGDNELSRIIASPVGYHIFKMELIKPEKTKKFESVQDEIYKILYREEINRLKKQYIQSLRTETFIKIID